MGITSYIAAPSPQFGENARRISLPSILAAGVGAVARIVNAVIFRALAVTRAPALGLWLFFAPPVSDAFDMITNMVTSVVPANIGNLSFISTAEGQPAKLTKSQ